jgi:putative nucleotidyltransferase with HDIG domain
MDLAFGLAAAKVFNVSSSKGVYNPKILWHHSLCIALIAQHICQQIPEFKKYGAFTAGLLHDCGKIFLMENYFEDYMKIYYDAEKYDIPLYELEEEKYGMSHETIGQFLASGWNLPEHLVEAIGFHHRPGSALNYPQLAAIIGLADYLHYKAIQSGALSSEAINAIPCQLTCGHWSYLKQIFKNISIKELKEKADNVAGIMNNNKDLLNILN